MTTNDCNSTQVAATETARQPAAEPGQHCVCLCRVQALSCYRPLGSDADVRERRGRAPGSRSKRVNKRVPEPVAAQCLRGVKLGLVACGGSHTVSQSQWFLQYYFWFLAIPKS
jgi:hypothetical protein